jgi:hypothetical protein
VLLVSGDGNIVSAVVGSAGSTLPNDNDTFFLNVLGSGTEVRILSTAGGGSPSLSAADTELNGFYNGIAGVTSSLIAGPITAASLAGVDLFAVILPDAAFTAAEIAAMSGLLAGGGTLFLMGDNSSFPVGNAAINAALGALGSGMAIVPGAIDAGFTLSTPLIHPLTAGVSNFQYAATSSVSGGTPLFLTASGAQPFVAVEGAVIPEPATVALAACGAALLLLGTRRSRQ